MLRRLSLLIYVLGMLAVLILPGYTAAAQDDNREYIGARECRDCHRDIARPFESSNHALALQDVQDEEDKAVILGDFTQGDDLRTVQIPGESEPRPFAPDDIAFAIGAGRHAQAYLYQVDRDDYLVLPAQWNMDTQSWEKVALADSWPDDAYSFGPNCAGCHTVGLNPDDFRWEDDGVLCEACHGPGSAHADAADDAGGDINDEEMQAIRSAIVVSPDPQICGQCHSQGHDPSANHPYPINYLPGQTLVSDDVFQLVAGDDSAYWWHSGHAKQPNMQFNEWSTSAHAGALDTMRRNANADGPCLQCHSTDYRTTAALIGRYDSGDLEGSPPEPVTLDSAQFGVTCVACHDPHPQTDDAVTAALDVYTVCTDCHSDNPAAPDLHHPVREMFEGDPLIDGIAGVSGVHFSAAKGPRCANCHMPEVPVSNDVLSGNRQSHTLKLVLPDQTEDGQLSSCGQCHTDLNANDLQSLIDDTQDAVRTRLSAVQLQLASFAEPEAGTDADARYQKAVTAVTFVQNDGSLGVHNYAYADSLLHFAEQTLSELTAPSVTVQPTEAPAPTATPSATQTTTVADDQTARGLRPITILIIAGIIVFLGVAALLFFRGNRTEEA